MVRTCVDTFAGEGDHTIVDQMAKSSQSKDDTGFNGNLRPVKTTRHCCQLSISAFSFGDPEGNRTRLLYFNAESECFAVLVTITRRSAKGWQPLHPQHDGHASCPYLRHYSLWRSSSPPLRVIHLAEPMTFGRLPGKNLRSHASTTEAQPLDAHRYMD